MPAVRVRPARSHVCSSRSRVSHSGFHVSGFGMSLVVFTRVILVVIWFLGR
ncbi:hypothetical protein NFJ02_42g109340 [Pycnococcus provasolii]